MVLMMALYRQQKKVVEEIKAAGGEAMANGASVTDVTQVEEMVKQTMDAYGR